MELKNQKQFMLLFLALIMLVFAGCSSSTETSSNSSDSSKSLLNSKSETIDIYWEDIEITINDVSTIPSQFNETYYQYSLQYEITGNPSDNFYGSDSLGLITIYDENGNQCSFKPLSGMNKDVLVLENVEVVSLVRCNQENPKELQFIFRDSKNEYLEDIAGKVFLTIENQPITKTNEILTKYYDLKKEQEEKARLEEEKRKQEQKELEEKIKNFETEYNKIIDECIDNQDVIDKCMEEPSYYTDGYTGEQKEHDEYDKENYVCTYRKICGKKLNDYCNENEEICAYVDRHNYDKWY